MGVKLIGRSLFYNLGAVFMCFCCFFVLQSSKPVVDENFKVVNIPVRIHSAYLSNIQRALTDIDSVSGVEIILEDNSLRLRMSTDKMFRISRAELNGEAQSMLKALSAHLRSDPPSHVHIEGHTNDEPTNTPQYPNNWYLSAARAIAVGMFLGDEGIERVTAQGFGDSVPLGRPEEQKNARIEIIVTP